MPGDTFSLSTTALVRMATPIFPIMDNVFLDFHFFLVPMRLLWEHWEEFNGAQANPGDSIDYIIPQVPAPSGGWTEGSLGDYLGLPIELTLLRPASLFVVITSFGMRGTETKTFKIACQRILMMARMLLQIM